MSMRSEDLPESLLRTCVRKHKMTGKLVNQICAIMGWKRLKGGALPSEWYHAWDAWLAKRLNDVLEKGVHK